MKNLTLIYCGEDSEAAIALAKSIRAQDTDNKVIMTSTEFFDGRNMEADRVVIMPDVPEHGAKLVRDAYPASVILEDDKTRNDCVQRFDNALVFEGATLSDDELSKKLSTIEIVAPRRRGRPRKDAA